MAPAWSTVLTSTCSRTWLKRRGKTKALQAISPAENSSCYTWWSVQRDCLTRTHTAPLLHIDILKAIGLCIVWHYISLPSCRLVHIHMGIWCPGSGVHRYCWGSNQHLNQTGRLLRTAAGWLRRGWRYWFSTLSLCQEYLYKCPSAHTSECNLHQSYSLLFISSSFCVKQGARYMTPDSAVLDQSLKSELKPFCQSKMVITRTCLVE